ncbi:hypothetical protein PVAND_004896 [Polypedilum vanderplanki]|uniref:Uncharacterized protein n=1 Tax=Polypedilum vanderplanki TaxID=319348 RepID=A0A9J6BZ44_POLVA|nr:hypothetical protein PVAND_004896 [Polypedilum vanderplanki]
MSKSNELIEGWNGFFREHRISEEDLKNVNENSFRCWLILILNKLNVDTSNFENMHLENGLRLKTSRLKLLSTVNHFLNVDNLMKLNYMNLVAPDTKTVKRALKYLMNFVFFYNQFYSNTISKCAQELSERNELQSRKNHIRKEIEQAKITEEKVVKTLRELDKTVPQQKSTVAILQENEERLKLEVNKIEEEIEKCDLKIAENKTQIITINESIVPEEEAKSILLSREKVMQQLEEQEDIITACRQKLKENSASIEVANSLVLKMEAILSQYNVDTTVTENMKKKLENLESNVNQLKRNIANMSSEKQSLTQQIQFKKDNIAKLIKQREEVEKTIGNEDKANVQILKQLTLELRDLSARENEMVEKENTVKEEMNLIFKVGSNVFKQMNESIYEDNYD